MARHGKLTMRTMLLASFLAGTMALAVSSSAKADQGCGPGWWRGPWGHCRDTPYSGNLPGGGVGTNVGESYWNGNGYGGNGCPAGWWRGPWGHCRDTPYHGRLPDGSWQ
jgi:hypothetical protein